MTSRLISSLVLLLIAVSVVHGQTTSQPFASLERAVKEERGGWAGASDYHLHKNGLGQPDLYENLTPVERNGYLTDLLTDRAVDYIRRRRTAPF